MSNVPSFTSVPSINQSVTTAEGRPLLVDAKGLAKLLCSGVRSVRTWDASGKLPKPLRIGGRVLWNIAEIRDWIDAGSPDRQTWEARKAQNRK